MPARSAPSTTSWASPRQRCSSLRWRGLIVGAFVLKDVFSILFRWWQLTFMARNQVAIQARILEGYLVGPYAWHLTKNTSDKLWTVQGAVGIGLRGRHRLDARRRHRDR